MTNVPPPPDLRALRPGQSLTGFFIVRKKEIRPKKDGTPYLYLELGNPTGRLSAVWWEDWESRHENILPGRIVKAQGRVTPFQDRNGLRIERIRTACPSDEIDLEAFLPTRSIDTPALWEDVDRVIASIQVPALQRLLSFFFADPAFRTRFGRSPGGKLWHHAYLGGLLEHTRGVVRLCEAVSLEKTIDRDLLLTAALLHDIGKLTTYRMEGFIEYSDHGRLWSHLVIGVMEIGQAIRVLKTEGEFPEEIEKQLIHLVLSHHGSQEKGSPVVPMMREALILHAMDELDATLNALDHVAERDGAIDRTWSRYVPVMDRFFYLGGSDGEPPLEANG